MHPLYNWMRRCPPTNPISGPYRPRRPWRDALKVAAWCAIVVMVVLMALVMVIAGAGVYP